MKNFFYIVLVVSLITSCSEYQKALKSEDTGRKFNLGDSLYSQGKYAKANKLFAQIVPAYRGKPQAEKLMYLYSKTFYELKDYYIAGYQFERFASSYPNSEKAEEAAFLGAKSYYMLSPLFSKDQKETNDAIEKLQTFIDLYPESTHIIETNKLMKELEFKLEKKAFAIAKQYNTISDFNAAMKSFENFLFDFPGSQLREDALYYRFDSAYKLAMNSVEYKKKVRLEIAKDYYTTFKKAFVNSKYIIEADTMALELEEELKEYSNTLNK